MNLTWTLIRLHNHLCETVEQRAIGFLVALLTIRIAVANANQGAFAGNFESEAIIRRWNSAPFFVECLNLQNCDILSVSVGSWFDRQSA